MDRDLLVHMPVLLAVARCGSFAGAAGELGRSPSAVSHAVKALEQRLGLPLFVRTTRSVALTESGRQLVDAMAAALGTLSEEVERLRAAQGEVAGLLRLNVPHIALPMAVTPVVPAMAAEFPQLTLEIFTEEASTDIVAGGFDAGIRVGDMIDRDMVTVRLTPPFQAIIVAAPDYLARHGRPALIADLAHHNCIGFRRPASRVLYDWELTDGQRELAMRTRGNVIVSDPLYARELAIRGLGLAYIFAPLVADALADGRLAQVLPDAAIEEPGLFLYFPAHARSSPKLRAFIDTARRVLDRNTLAKGALPEPPE